MRWISVSIIAIIVSAVGCTLYQSEGRKLLENGTIDTTPPPFFLKEEAASCYKSALAPEFLKLPLDAVATPYERRGYASLIDSKTHWLAVHRLDSGSGLNFSCEFQFKSARDLDLQLAPAIGRAVRLIDEQLGL